MAKPRTKGVAKKKTASPVPKLTEGERDLLDQMQGGYELETDSLGGNPVLRRLQDGEVIRPLSANASTVKALQDRGLIHATKSRDPLTLLWRLKKS
jgi:hypothetical protein